MPQDTKDVLAERVGKLRKKLDAKVVGQSIHDYAPGRDCRRDCWAVLALLWFGVAGVVVVGKTNLMYVFWPASVMLVVGWCRTIPGMMMITASAVAINGLLYMLIASSPRVVVRLIAHR